ncbi:MAG: type I restriction endonuclease [Candidatus Poribacteria bacterium]|nr:type I restriction endonuclease [Candidatus Poribacteria bacterium]
MLVDRARLITRIDDIRSGLRAGRFANEAAVSQGCILPILGMLGWDRDDTEIVFPEYSMKGQRVDYALCHPRRKPVAFIEVKQTGKGEGSEQQLFQYAYMEGVQLAILTDGREWSFFLPAERGNFEERRVYKLDIVERDNAECADRLTRYLEYASVVSGEAIDAAREDYRNIARAREVRDTLPKAWVKLVSERDELLLGIIAECVEDLCGYKPSVEVVAHFASNDLILRSPLSSMPPHSSHQMPESDKPTTKPGIEPAENDESSSVSSKEYCVTVLGKRLDAESARGVLVQFLESLYERDKRIFEKFVVVRRSRKGSRPYISQNLSELYPNSPQLLEEQSSTHQLKSGWWVGLNASRVSINRIIEIACEAAELKLGVDVFVNLGD